MDPLGRSELVTVEKDPNFKYYIELALQDQMSWDAFVSLMDDLAPTLHKSKLLNIALIDVVRRLKMSKENNLEELQILNVTTTSKKQNCEKKKSKHNLRKPQSLNKAPENKRATVTKPKPFACDICGKTFPMKMNLAKHKNSHKDQTPNKVADDITVKEASEKCTLLGSRMGQAIRIKLKRLSYSDIENARISLKMSLKRKNSPSLLVPSKTARIDKEIRIKVKRMSLSDIENAKIDLKMSLKRKNSRVVPSKTAKIDNSLVMNETSKRKNKNAKSLRINETSQSSSRNPFSCEHCDKSFSMARYLGNHKRTHKKDSLKKNEEFVTIQDENDKSNLNSKPSIQENDKLSYFGGFDDQTIEQVNLMDGNISISNFGGFDNGLIVDIGENLDQSTNAEKSVTLSSSNISILEDTTEYRGDDENDESNQEIQKESNAEFFADVNSFEILPLNNHENETLTHERFLDAIVENQFKCDKCCKTFDDGNSLRKHLSQHI